MKRGYKKLLVFCTIMLIILLLNSFSLNILSRYKMVIFLAIAMAVFKVFFGYEKDRHRYIKDVILDITIFLSIFFILYYLFGVVIGFARTNFISFTGITQFIIPAILYVTLREIFRYMMLCKAEGNKQATVFVVVTLILLDITASIYAINYASKISIFRFVALSLLPAISTNIALSYIVTKVGYKPTIYYALIIELYQFLLPIIPDPNEYVLSIIEFVVPVILAYRVHHFFKKDRDEELIRDYNKKHIISLIAPAIITVILVYFTSGYFRYYTVSIASGSMNPKIKKGDAVIIEKIDEKYDTLKVGQVIAFRHDEKIIVHRLVKIIKEGNQYYFYTKGDANYEIDNFVIEQNEILGPVSIKIPYAGWPTVLLNEL